MPRERVNAHISNRLQRAGSNTLIWFCKKADRAGQGEDKHHAEYKTPVTDAISNERLLRRVSRFFAIDVVTDQQIRAEPHSLPAHKHQQKVVGQNESQHGKHEKVEESEEAIETPVLVHVADSKEVDQ